MTLRDTEIFGCHIPKGATVWMLCNGPSFHSPSFDAAVAQRGPSTETDFSRDWDETRDMFTFEPERWLRKKKRASSSTMTENDAVEFNANAPPQAAFGLGLRGCWGRKLAYVDLRMLVTLVVWHFDLLPVAPSTEQYYGHLEHHPSVQCLLCATKEQGKCRQSLKEEDEWISNGI